MRAKVMIPDSFKYVPPGEAVRINWNAFDNRPEEGGKGSGIGVTIYFSPDEAERVGKELLEKAVLARAALAAAAAAEEEERRQTSPATAERQTEGTR